jgi:hypothetical protein
MKTMKGKYITTSLLLAIMASERSAQMADISETKASVEGHQLIWSKNIPSSSELRARMQGRDELKLV